MRGRGALLVEVRLGRWRRIRVVGLGGGGLAVIRLCVRGLSVLELRIGWGLSGC